MRRPGQGKPTNLLRPLRELSDAEVLVEIGPDKEGVDSSPDPVDGVGEAQNDHPGFLALLGLLLGAVAAAGSSGQGSEGKRKLCLAEQWPPGAPGAQRWARPDPSAARDRGRA